MSNNYGQHFFGLTFKNKKIYEINRGRARKPDEVDNSKLSRPV
jgi:hypothetical protein